ncbi:death domain-containing protein CRADD [Protopterus annectens]|uniref:death domain-containing protein CRADD n=1 Tax=Protopterus annectens TaxID=7888 RepID=UPI001CFBE67B|nr:death domain-containing protein CRADD [Protopterus annectens]XP_043920814.1 death domain-containing protein CRADD [Protopterus annectens]XP_043920815.1 death domain-containing protein CRADD [Protopterus annectens]XP_043920816.1 death domain-containing protein CRADD [Protopterus annectens]XP_043920817.1 death domain-containing protein CRADD [Protopterus annectens]
MNARHKQILRKFRLEISSQILVDGLVVQYLYQEGVLTQNQVEEIKSENTNQKKAMKLLDILPIRGPKSFEKFLESLEEFPWVREKLIWECMNQEMPENQAESWMYRVPEHILNSVPPDKQLNKLASKLGSEWESIVFELGLSSVDIYKCKVHYPHNVQSQIVEALVLWKRRCGKKATVHSLCEVLTAQDVDPAIVIAIFQ